MGKSTLAEVVVTVLGALIAVKIAANLNDHNVSAAVIILVIAFTLSVGFQVAGDVGKAISTTVYRCPTKGCPVTIRAPKDVGQDALAGYRDQATDHTNHPTAGTR